MVRHLTIIAAFLFFLVPAISFSQSNNNCIPWSCQFPPSGCQYCTVNSSSNGNSSCIAEDTGEGYTHCWLLGFCDTGLGGCSGEINCAYPEVMYKNYWIRLLPPRSLSDEWQLVDVSVRRKAVHHLRRS